MMPRIVQYSHDLSRMWIWDPGGIYGSLSFLLVRAGAARLHAPGHVQIRKNLAAGPENREFRFFYKSPNGSAHQKCNAILCMGVRSGVQSYLMPAESHVAKTVV